MKKSILVCCILLFSFVSLPAQQNEFPKLTGPYLGQKPPGMTPELFAPGIISTGLSEATCTFSPEGDEIIYPLVYRKPHSDKVHSSMVTSRMKNGFWSASVDYR